MKKLKLYLLQAYRLLVKAKKKDALVWNDLKKLHSEAQYRFGVYEKEKYIEALFKIAEEVPISYYYMIYEDSYHCRVRVAEAFPTDLTTDVFVLAAHFNNILVNGGVIINVQSQYVEYHTKCELLIPLLYPGELHNQLLRHYNTSKDVYWAFQKLLIENEPPALIIADLMKMYEKENSKEK